MHTTEKWEIKTRGRRLHAARVSDTAVSLQTTPPATGLGDRFVSTDSHFIDVLVLCFLSLSLTGLFMFRLLAVTVHRI